MKDFLSLQKFYLHVQFQAINVEHLQGVKKRTASPIPWFSDYIFALIPSNH